jgi:hypothetical protein
MNEESDFVIDGDGEVVVIPEHVFTVDEADEACEGGSNE